MTEKDNMNNVTEAVEVKEAPAVVEEIPKKVRKPREKARSIEECYDLPVTKLSDKEKNNLITELKSSLNQAINQAEAYKQNAQSAFEQTRQLEDQYKEMEKYYREKLRYVDAQLKAFHAAINEALKGGIA